MKLLSWNVNGVRAAAGKGFFEKVEEMNPDVLCLQETKAQDDQVRETLFGMDYHMFSNSAEKKGYSGTAILSKTEPKQVVADMGITQHDKEGRVLAAEYDDFWLVTVYTPNSQNGLARLDYRAQWDIDFKEYIQGLESSKPVVICGDLNVAHRPIDIKNDKSNYNKTPGYTQKEIDGMDALLGVGFIDTFRYFYPEEEKFSWWSFRANARPRNIGWRIDYFLASQQLEGRLKDAVILNDMEGSDHCPVGLIMD
ncbi:MAG: exodeoxyribonuclease III [Flavobacteriales bacterium]|nr:exodeoxyribonuclease III [Flavobacteriales bacterium]